mgnify:FL=1
MKYDTAGNKIVEMIYNCGCGLTCGCERCNFSLQIGYISDEEAEKMKGELEDWKRIFDDDCNKRFLKKLKK